MEVGGIFGITIAVMEHPRRACLMRKQQIAVPDQAPETTSYFSSERVDARVMIRISMEFLCDSKTDDDSIHDPNGNFAILRSHVVSQVVEK